MRPIEAVSVSRQAEESAAMEYAADSTLDRERLVATTYHHRIARDYAGLVREVKLMLDGGGLATLEDFVDLAFLALMR